MSEQGGEREIILQPSSAEKSLFEHLVFCNFGNYSFPTPTCLLWGDPIGVRSRGDIARDLSVIPSHLPLCCFSSLISCLPVSSLQMPKLHSILTHVLPLFFSSLPCPGALCDLCSGGKPRKACATSMETKACFQTLLRETVSILGL